MNATRTLILAIIITANTYFCTATGRAICSNGDLRLSDGSTDLVGRVEICFNDEWGSVCADNSWTESHAQVVCRQLGHLTQGAAIMDSTHFAAGTGPIHLNGISCTGNETHLLECSSSRIGDHNCSHTNDVGVACHSNDDCNEGEVRLVGGTAENEGRVEVCFNGQFGSICDDGWDEYDAAVVCKQLGFASEGAIALASAAYGEGYGHVYLDELQCTGNEPNITECTHQGVSNTNCGHSEDAAVICKPPSPPCKSGDIRLVNGRMSSEGRIEVCQNGIWGTVCHDHWSDEDAGVACQQLGFTSEGARAVRFADFGEGEGPILLDNVQCNGAERFLNECSSNGLGVHNCGHHKDAGVICRDPNFICANGDIRLVGGNLINEGRVEVCHDNHYGTVCEDNWNTAAAGVVCGALGFETEGAIALKGGYYDNGVGLIHLDDVQCTGDESGLLQCEHSGIGISNCFHHQDAAVICRVKNTSVDDCTDGDIRLVGGSVANEGLVEVCINGVWGTICGEEWDTNDATVACHQLGYSNSGGAIIAGTMVPTNDDPALINKVHCSGTEANLSSCFTMNDIGVSSCSKHAIAVCPPTSSSCENGDVRLVGGGMANQGRVEMCYNNVWGSVCADNGQWTQSEASVVCKQLGYNITETRAIPIPNFGYGVGPVFLSGVSCYGVEANLLQCNDASVRYSSCPHTQDVGVYCAAYPCVDGTLRLAGGSNDGEGILEMCSGGQWEAVCATGFSSSNANEICSHFGYEQGYVSQATLFQASAGTNFGSSYSFTMCQSDAVNCLKDLEGTALECGADNVIGIICQRSDNCTTGDVRLSDGKHDKEGRVEVCIGGRWGTVCDDYWDDKASSVVCQQMGYSHGVTAAEGQFGEGIGDIYLDNVQCSGSEENILSCPSNGLRNHNCHHREDVGVVCKNDARMVGTRDPTDEPVTIASEETTDSNGEGSAAESMEEDKEDTTNSEEITDSTIERTVHVTVIVSVICATLVVIVICITITTFFIYKLRRQRLMIHATKPTEIDHRNSCTVSPLPAFV